MADVPPTNIPPEARNQMEPHRDSTVLIFGILGLVVCTVFAILAWVFGKNDLDKMDQGIMDPTGRSNTKTGKLLGMIGTLIAAAGIGILLIVLIVSGGLFLAVFNNM